MGQGVCVFMEALYNRQLCTKREKNNTTHTSLVNFRCSYWCQTCFCLYVTNWTNASQCVWTEEDEVWPMLKCGRSASLTAYPSMCVPAREFTQGEELCHRSQQQQPQQGEQKGHGGS